MRFDSDPKIGGSGGGSFLTLKNGDSITGVFRGEVFEFYGAYINGRTEIGEKGAPGMKFKFRINFVMKDKDGVLVAKIWERGAIDYTQLKALSLEYNLEETVMKITRNGDGKNTSYTILPSGKEKMTPSRLKEIEQIQLHPLEVKQLETVGAMNSFDEEPPF